MQRGTYTFDYEICETGNLTNCATATVTVVVTGLIDAVDDDLSSTPVTSGAAAVADVLNVLDATGTGTADTLNGVAVTTSTVTISTPAAGVVPAQLVFDPADGSVDVAANAASGTYTFDYEICETGNLTNCATATVTVVVTGLIDAVDDDLSSTPVTSGAAAVADVLNVLDATGTGTADTLNGVAVTTSTVTISTPAAGVVPAQLVFDPADGSVDVAANAASGTYTFDYEICETGNLTNCATATVTVVVTGLIDAVDDDLSSTPVTSGAAAVADVLNVLDATGTGTADTLNGVAVTTSTVTISTPAAGVVPAQLVFDPADGSVDVAANAASGTYTFDYEICETGNLTNCATATVTVVVTGLIDAVDDDLSSTPVTSGAAAVADVLNVLDATGTGTADTLNGVAVTTSTVTISTPAAGVVPAQLVFDPADGSVDVAANAASGTYTFDYEICETGNLTNCATATVTVVVTGLIDAVDDDLSSTPVTSGAAAVADVLNVLDATGTGTADTLNGVAVTTSTVTISTPAAGVVPAQLVFDPADGSVDVAANAASGTYTFDYEICETGNLTNCATATVTVVVTGLIDAVDDDLSSTPVTSGAAAVADVLNVLDATGTGTADTLNGVAVTTSTVTISTPAAGVVPAQLVFDPADGSVDVAANAASGTYTFDYEICETGNLTNCATATVTVVVTGLIDAVDDDLSSTPVTSGAAAVADVLNVLDATGTGTADTLNGVAVTTSTVTISTPAAGVVPAQLVFDPADGSVDVAANAASGTYTFDYEICETGNLTNCATATVTVVVTGLIDAVDDDLSSTPVTSGAAAVADVLNVLDATGTGTADTLNGVAVTTSTVTISTPAAGVVPAQLVFDPADGSVDVAANAASGTYTFDYEICETGNLTNCATATVTVVVTGLIDAVDDDLSSTPVTSGGAAVAGVLNVLDATGTGTADTLNGVAVTTSTVTISTPAAGVVPAQLVFDPADGSVDVAANAASGTYTFDYEICETGNLTNCATATVTVVVTGLIDAVDDDLSSTPVTSGGAAVAGVLNVLDATGTGTADTLNGVAVTTSTVTISTPAAGVVPAQLVFDPADGSVDVAANAASGTYTFDYEICETGNLTNCATATVTVVVTGLIDAVDDDLSSTPVTSGGAAVAGVLNVLDATGTGTADTLNGVAVTTSTVTISTPAAGVVPAQLVFDPADGSVDVAANAASGTYTFDYEICETGNLTNCATATVTVVVTGLIDAVDDDLSSTPVTSGGAAVADVLNVLDATGTGTADTLNGVAVTTSTVTISTPAAGVVPAQLVFDPADGSVDVAANAASGTYTFDYEICETGNLTNCATATVTVVVTGLIDAVDDDLSSTPVTSGGAAVADVLNVLDATGTGTADTLNGVAVTTSTVTISTPAAGVVPAQLVFDPADGSVDVAANAASGTYTFDYEICETGNLTNCATATVTVNVIGSADLSVNKTRRYSRPLYIRSNDHLYNYCFQRWSK